MYANDNMLLYFCALVFWKHYNAAAGITILYVDDKMFLNFYALLLMKQYNVAAGIGTGVDEKDIYKG
eukprot:12910221-Heterocapsa_arctica.AAC.1